MVRVFVVLYGTEVCLFSFSVYRTRIQTEYGGGGSDIISRHRKDYISSYYIRSVRCKLWSQSHASVCLNYRFVGSSQSSVVVVVVVSEKPMLKVGEYGRTEEEVNVIEAATLAD